MLSETFRPLILFLQEGQKYLNTSSLMKFKSGDSNLTELVLIFNKKFYDLKLKDHFHK